MEEIEEWKSLDIIDYPDYEISSFGQVKSIERVVIYSDGRKRTFPEKILKLSKGKNNYLKVCLYQKGKGKTFTVHQLVAQTFIPNPENLPMINHKNEIKTDNRVENLEFCTAKHNSNYGTRNKRLSKIMSGENNPMYGKISPNCKPIQQYTKDMVFICDWDSATTASKELNIDRSGIIYCCKGRYNTCGGFIWRYKDVT